ncbi:hypothetical protein, partial [Pseudomonas syringae group genomosp. 7]|uniref:hypothetical protein n=1 Tax=Pseudomonas syringae group genomosp. 7 TaxID=251699 RepID=UPI003770769F
ISGIDILDAGQLSASADLSIGCIKQLDAQLVSLNHLPEIGEIAGSRHLHLHADDCHQLLNGLRRLQTGHESRWRGRKV